MLFLPDIVAHVFFFLLDLLDHGLILVLEHFDLTKEAHGVVQLSKSLSHHVVFDGIQTACLVGLDLPVIEAFVLAHAVRKLLGDFLPLCFDVLKDFNETVILFAK